MVQQSFFNNHVLTFLPTGCDLILFFFGQKSDQQTATRTMRSYNNILIMTQVISLFYISINFDRVKFLFESLNSVKYFWSSCGSAPKLVSMIIL